jgi:phosphoribosylglycinamide formyltransferase-1
MRLGVLASGSGSNLQAILDACASRRIPAEVSVVVCNVAGAKALQRAEAAGVPAVLLSHRQFASREEYDVAMIGLLQRHRVDLVCLAGFMRLITPVFLRAFENKILNIHPSLLPAFPGMHAVRDALARGCASRAVPCTWSTKARTPAQS